MFYDDAEKKGRVDLRIEDFLKIKVQKKDSQKSGLAKGKMNKASLLFANSKFLKNFVFVNTGVLSRERKGEKRCRFKSKSCEERNKRIEGLLT